MSRLLRDRKLEIEKELQQHNRGDVKGDTRNRASEKSAL